MSLWLQTQSTWSIASSGFWRERFLSSSLVWNLKTDCQWKYNCPGSDWNSIKPRRIIVVSQRKRVRITSHTRICPSTLSVPLVQSHCPPKIIHHGSEIVCMPNSSLSCEKLSLKHLPLPWVLHSLRLQGSTCMAIHLCMLSCHLLLASVSIVSVHRLFQTLPHVYKVNHMIYNVQNYPKFQAHTGGVTWNNMSGYEKKKLTLLPVKPDTKTAVTSL